jgi:Mg-chelatase subunit ChlD
MSSFVNSLAFVLLAGLAAASGCGSSGSASDSPSGRSPFLLIVGIDTSVSARHNLNSYAAVLRRLAVRMNRPGDQMSILRFDNESREVSGPRPPRGSLSFMKELAKTAKPLPDQPGTYHAVFMQRAARLAEGSALPVVLLLLTDGVNDDLSNEAMAAMKTTAKTLAANPSFVRCIWAGVAPGWRERVRAEMQQPLGRERLAFESLDAVQMQVVQP